MAPAKKGGTTKKKGVARKSTHSKSKRIEKSAKPVIKEIDATVESLFYRLLPTLYLGYVRDRQDRPNPSHVGEEERQK